MAVAFGSISSTTWAARTNTVITAPSGISDGDRLVLFHVIGSSAPPTPTPPPGFVALPGTWPQSVQQGGYTMIARAWSKVASGESGSYTVTHALTGGSFGACLGAMVRVTGADPTSPFTPSPVANLNGELGEEANTTFTGLTTVADESLILLLGWDWGDTGNNLTPPTGSTPTFTERLDTTVVYIASGVLATAGATGNKTMANNANTGSPWGAVTIAIQPVAGGGSTHETVSWASSYVVNDHATTAWQSSYVTRARVTTSWASSYATKIRQGASWASAFVVNDHAQASWASSYTVNARQSTTWQSGYGVAGHASAQWASNYTVRARQPVSWVSSWTTRARGTASWQSSYTTNARTVVSWASAYLLAGRVTTTWASTYQVQTPGAAHETRSWSSSWTTRTRATATWGSNYGVAARETTTWASTYAVQDRLAASWPSSFTTRTRNAADWVTSYRVDARLATEWASGYLVLSTGMLPATASGALLTASIGYRIKATPGRLTAAHPGHQMPAVTGAASKNGVVP